jgi:hypothetical protein
MKKLLVLIAVSMVMSITLPAKAGSSEPHPVTCWFFKRENLELKNTCIHESTSWFGGGGQSLRWEDGVVNHITWGLQGRGERLCKQDYQQVDGVCGATYYRSTKTLKRLSESEKWEVKSTSIRCVQLKEKSICWK